MRFLPALVLTMPMTLPATASASTILETVLLLLDQYDQAPFAEFFGNIAENIANPMLSSRSLRAQDTVVYGLDAGGAPLIGVATEAGLQVTPEMAATARFGLAAGLYPVGSALYLLPPAGQLSLYQQDQNGAALARATETVLSRVDGSITQVITQTQFPDLMPATLASAYDPSALTRRIEALDVGQLAATALGAVNTGQVVTQVVVGVDALPGFALLSERMASIATGASATAQAAAAGSVRAESWRLAAPGSAAAGRFIALNEAYNGTAVSARVTSVIEATGAAISSAVATALGAVNSGTVTSPPGR